MARHSRKAVNPKVLLDGYHEPALQCIEVENSIGGRRMSYAKISLDYGHWRASLPGDIKYEPRRSRQNVDHVSLLDVNEQDIPSYLRRKVQIIFESSADNLLTEDAVVHWGEFSAKEMEIGENEDTLILVSRVLPKHFGDPLTFQRVGTRASLRQGSGGAGDDDEPWVFDVEALYVDEQVVFNPVVDDMVLGNMLDGEGDDYPHFKHPDQRRTQTAVDQDQADEGDFLRVGTEEWDKESTPYNWGLAEAVLYLCHECNRDERHFKNPTREELEQWIHPDDRRIDLIVDHKIPVGVYLPEALDLLLEPYGYRWSPQFTRDENRIRIFSTKAVEGVDRFQNVHLQKAGEVVDRDKTNMISARLDADAKRVVDAVLVYGDYSQIEVTATLLPGWDYDLNPDANPNDPHRGSVLWDKMEPDIPGYGLIYRKFVWNEGGDYTRENNNVEDQQFEVPDLTKAFREVFGDNHPVVPVIRRKFLPMLTLDQAEDQADDDGPVPTGRPKPRGRHHGIHVQWKNWENDNRWEDIPESWSFKVLKDECGIYFDGDHESEPVSTFLDQLCVSGRNATPHIRVVASVSSYRRISAGWNNDQQQNGEDQNTLVLYRPNVFHARKVYRKTGTDDDGNPEPELASLFDDLADEVDDFSRIQRFADTIGKNFNRGEITGPIVLEGIDREGFLVGKYVKKIDGRDIDLQQGSGDTPAEDSWPQIVAVRWNVPNQETTLFLEDVGVAENLLLKR